MPDPPRRAARRPDAPLRSEWARAAAVVRGHPVAALLPAFALGAAADALQLVGSGIAAQVALGIALGVAFELYVAYAERLLIEIEREDGHVEIAHLLREALPILPPLLAAGLLAVTLPLAAAGLLVIPGLWLLTRWSLFAPAIAREGLGAVASLRRSNELVRGRFWPVFGVVTIALLIEHGVIHATAHTAEPVLGSQALALVVAAFAVAAVSPIAAFTVSLVYDRLSGDPATSSRPRPPRPPR
jgi:hypothetical protein